MYVLTVLSRRLLKTYYKFFKRFTKIRRRSIYQSLYSYLTRQSWEKSF